MSDHFKCKCGSERFWKMSPTVGVWSDYMESTASGMKIIEASTDSLRHLEPKTIKCAACGKRVPNPDYTA